MDDLHPHDPARLMSLLAGHTPDELRQTLDLYRIAGQVHQGERRASGAPYITHPLAVAELMAEWRLPIDCVHAALLHDLPDSGVDPRALRGQVRDDVISAVQVLATIDASRDPAELLRTTTDEREREVLRTAILVKIADRLHNARTWQYLPVAKARLRARQTLGLIAPVAERQGLSGAASELTTLSLRMLAGSRSERLTVATFCRSLELVPAHVRDRYAVEWAGDLASLERPGQRLRFVLGLLYSAAQLRRPPAV
jgi:guanosine-3',5'-bis(diphosphate) 3'-pyrophosphohydrolase